MWDLCVGKMLPCVGGTDLAGAMMVHLLNTGVRWMEGTKGCHGCRKEK